MIKNICFGLLNLVKIPNNNLELRVTVKAQDDFISNGNDSTANDMITKPLFKAIIGFEQGALI